MRDTKTTNTDRDLLVIELYDEDFDKNNTIILTEQAPYFKYWQKNYFPIVDVEYYYEEYTDDDGLYRYCKLNQRDAFARRIGFPTKLI